MSAPRRVMLDAGTRFGRLVVVGVSTQRTAAGKPGWLCRCDCGGSKIAACAELRGGLTISCGCAKRDHNVYLVACGDAARVRKARLKDSMQALARIRHAESDAKAKAAARRVRQREQRAEAAAPAWANAGEQIDILAACFGMRVG